MNIRSFTFGVKICVNRVDILNLLLIMYYWKIFRNSNSAYLHKGLGPIPTQWMFTQGDRTIAWPTIMTQVHELSRTPVSNRTIQYTKHSKTKPVTPLVLMVLMVSPNDIAFFFAASAFSPPEPPPPQEVWPVWVTYGQLALPWLFSVHCLFCLRS